MAVCVRVLLGADTEKTRYIITKKERKECLAVKKRFTGDAKSLIIE